jgi:hypothetical protein
MWLFLKSIGLGFALSGALTAAVLLAGIVRLASLYILSSAPGAYLVGALIPTRFLYWLAPEGGAPAGIFVVLLGAFLQWGTVLSALVFWLLRRKMSSNPALQPTDAPSARYG